MPIRLKRRSVIWTEERAISVTTLSIKDSGTGIAKSKKAMGKKAILKDLNPYRVISIPAKKRIEENTAKAIEYLFFDKEGAANMYRIMLEMVIAKPGKGDGVSSEKIFFLFLSSKKPLIRGIIGMCV